LKLELIFFCLGHGNALFFEFTPSTVTILTLFFQGMVTGVFKQPGKSY
jgi:hypothetical protein